MCKTWGRIRMWIGIVLMLIRICIGINVEIRIRIGIKTMPIHNTVFFVFFLLTDNLFCYDGGVPYRITETYKANMWLTSGNWLNKEQRSFCAVAQRVMWRFW
jgi:hypothetical protein